MAVFIRNREEFDQEIVSMHTHEGWSVRGLARHFGVSRNLVRRIIRKYHKYRNEGHDILKPAASKPAVSRASKLDRFDDKIKSLLEEYPNITGQRVFEELCNDGYKGGITIVRDRLHALRPKPKREPVTRFETEPGIQGQMDWSPYTIKFTQTGKTIVQCFSFILGFSRRQFIDFTPRRDFFTLIRRHQDAFAHFNGTPAQCLYDSETTIVLRWEAGRPVINPAFSAFITHYGIRPVICRRGRAEKGQNRASFLVCGNKSA